jgi:hypothetical protein
VTHDPADPEVAAALARQCWLCRQPVGQWCVDMETGGPLRSRMTGQVLPAHFARLHAEVTPEPVPERAPRTRKPPVRRAPVSAAQPIVVDAKDLRRRK